MEKVGWSIFGNNCIKVILIIWIVCGMFSLVCVGIVCYDILINISSFVITMGV